MFWLVVGPALFYFLGKEAEVGTSSYRCLVAAVCLWAGWSMAVRADSFTTNIISSGVSTDADFDYILGDTGSFNYLQIDSGGSFVCTTVLLGYSFAASNNAALVTGSGSVWTATYGFFVGEDSPGDSVIVSNGGRLATANVATIGDGIEGSNCLVIVTGTNSLWSNSGSLIIGHQSPNDQLWIQNGAQVTCSNVVIVGDDLRVSSSNSLVIVGPGSQFSDDGSLAVGAGGGTNLVYMSSGARLSCVGAFFDGLNNVVLVTGSNTVWTNGGSLQLADYSGVNRLTISDGAMVSNTDCYIGDAAGAYSNIVVVSGAGAIWNAGMIFLGDNCSDNQLVISNGAVVNNTGIDIGFPGANNQLIVARTNTVCNTGTINVGGDNNSYCADNKNNQLWIENGARVLGTLYAGIGACGEGNQVVVTGAGSQWTGIGQLILGPADQACQFTIANGATVQAG